MTSAFVSSSSASSSSSSSLLPSSVFPMPKEEDLDAVWQQFLKDSSEKIDGVDPKVARVIFLGNIHTEKWWQKDWRDAIIAHYQGMQGAIVLCEGWPAFAEMPPRCVSSFTPQKNVRVYGWDDMAAFKDNSSIRTIEALKEKYKKAPASLWSREDRIAWSKAIEANTRDCDARTLSLIKTTRVFLHEYLKPGQKLIVIGGSDHLFSGKFNILEYFKGVKAALILPKERSITPAEDEKEYAKKILAQ